MERLRRIFILFSIIYIVFLNYGHATKEISELKIPPKQHSLFDPLDKALQVYNIQLILRPDCYVFSQLTDDYQNTIDNYDEIIAQGQDQSDNALDEISNKYFTAILPGNENKKRSGKFVKNGKEAGKNINRFVTAHYTHDQFSLDYNNWQLDYLNNLRNQPASDGYYFNPFIKVFCNSLYNNLSFSILQIQQKFSVNTTTAIQNTSRHLKANLEQTTNINHFFLIARILTVILQKLIKRGQVK